MNKIFSTITALTFAITAVFSSAAYAAGLDGTAFSEPTALQTSAADSTLITNATPSEFSLTAEELELIKNRLYAAIEQGMDENNKFTIPFTQEDNMTYDKCSAVQHWLLWYIFEDPELFYLKNEINPLIYDMNSNGIFDEGDLLASISVESSYTAAEIAEKQEKIAEKVSEVKEYVTAGKPQSDFDIALLVHDYIAMNVAYDYDSAEAQIANGMGIDSVLIDGLAVCQGYSLTYKYLLSQFGIECDNVYVNSKTEGASGHEWSMVKLGDKRYHVDITHDDPDAGDVVYHNHFLLSDDEINSMTDYDHSGWYTIDGTLTAESDEFSDSSIHQAASRIFLNNGSYYYARSNNNTLEFVRSADTGFADTEVLTDTNAKWYIVNNSGFTVSLQYIGMFTADNCLYYNDSKCLKKIDLSASQMSAETVKDFSEELPDGSLLLGSALSGGNIALKTGTLSTDNNNYVIATPGDPINYRLAYIVNFVTNCDTDIPAMYVAPSGTEKITDVPSLKKSGYIFSGWYADSEFNEAYDFSSPVVSDLTLYAKWINLNDVSLDVKDQLQISTDGSTLSGSISAKLSEDFADTEYYLAFFKDGILIGIDKNTTGTFHVSGLDISGDNNYTYSIFTWNTGLVGYHSKYSEDITKE